MWPHRKFAEACTFKQDACSRHLRSLSQTPKKIKLCKTNKIVTMHSKCFRTGSVAFSSVIMQVIQTLKREGIKKKHKVMCKYSYQFERRYSVENMQSFAECFRNKFREKITVIFQHETKRPIN